MVKRRLAFLFIGLSSVSFAQSSVDYANMHEDIQGLIQKVNDLTLRVDDLEHQNAELRNRVASAPAGTVSAAQLNAAIAEINAAIESSAASNKREILQIVSTQMEKLAKQTNAALDTITNAKIAELSAPRATVDRASPPSASGEAATSERKGGTYTVQKGETLALIAKKTGVRFQDLVSENKLSDPSKIFVGQVLILPASK